MKGTILLTPEGINLFLAGVRKSIDEFLKWLRSDPRFADIEVKESYSDTQPFKRMLVKLKREIITMRMPLIQPEKGRAPAVDAKTLKRWLDQPNLTYEERDLTNRDIAEEAKARTGVRVAPITIVGEEVFYGTFPSQKPGLIKALGLAEAR